MACVAGKLPIQISPWDTDACISANFSLKSPSWCSHSHPEIAAHPWALPSAQSPLCFLWKSHKKKRFYGSCQVLTELFNTIHKETPAWLWWWQTKSSSVLIKNSVSFNNWKEQSLGAAGKDNLFIHQRSIRALACGSPFPGTDKWWSAVLGVLSCSNSLLLQKEVTCYHSIPGNRSLSLALSSGTFPLMGWKDLIH